MSALDKENKKQNNMSEGGSKILSRTSVSRFKLSVVNSLGHAMYGKVFGQQKTPLMNKQ